ncbi:MAG: TetR/AcrR family transcriptional regulator [Clostridia bacterium]|nr:TetR/AcrR family transcriptional regulator [Clostridia bacterium]
MGQEVRQPKQERSIKKKNEIVKAGFELFSEVGYYSTNTAEIAKRAGVSTGIVYGYFKDKRDILLDVLDIYIKSAFNPVLDIFNSFPDKVDSSFMSRIVDAAILSHEKNANIHEALHSMSHSDEAINNKFMTLEDEITLTIADKLSTIGVNKENLTEKVHFAMDIVQSFAHEYVYDHHEYIDYEQMRKIVESTLTDLFK